MTTNKPDIVADESIHTDTSRYQDTDPNEFDALTIRSYTERSQIERDVQATTWQVPAIAYALLLVSVILIY